MTGHAALNSESPFLEQALAEHRELQRMVGTLRERLSLPADEISEADYQAGLEDLKRLKARLEAHFEQEEQGGYFDEAISRLPRIAPQAASLQKQHGEFVRVVSEILSPPQGRGTRHEHWRRMQTEFKQFARKLMAHERVEDEILGRAFNVEVG
jgi:iron-sulfur cluster repair protein YtfE (RIC family)